MNRKQALHTPFELHSYEKNGLSPNTNGRRRRDIRMEGRILRHQTELCEACHLNKCIGFYLRPDRLVQDE